MTFIDEEYETLTDTLNMGWRMWPDNWTGLQVLLDLFAEKILSNKVKHVRLMASLAL